MLRHCIRLICALFVLSVMLPTAVVRAEPSSSIVINELQLDGQLSKYQEFIELANIGTTPVIMTDWKVTVKNIDGSECTSTKPFVLTFAETLLLPGQTYLIAAQKDTTQYFSDKNPNMYYLPCSGNASVLAAEKAISLFDTTGVLIDEVIISNQAQYAASNPISYDSKTQTGTSFERMLDATLGIPIDTDNSLQDFMLTLVPTPGVLLTLPDPVEPLPVEPSPEDTTPPPVDEVVPDLPPVISETPPEVVTPVILQPITLNEIYIDPVSPQTDAQDEWVELYNPNASPVIITGYSIYSGEAFSYHYTFAADVEIPANSYLIVTSGESSLAFANGAGAVKLVTNSGEVLETVTYESAPSGQAWAKDESGVWKWTTTPTPAAQNAITQSLPKTIAKAAAVAKKTSKKATTTVKSKAATTKVAAAKTTKAKTTSTEVEGAAIVAAPSPMPVWLLAVLGALALLYSAYEYRFEAANKIYQFRQYRAHRKNNRR